MEEIKINKSEFKILRSLAKEYSEYGDEMYFSFDYIDEDFTKKEMSKICRSLREKGLIKYQRGLMSEDGEVAGSGYRCTHKGAEYIDSLIDSVTN